MPIMLNRDSNLSKMISSSFGSIKFVQVQFKESLRWQMSQNKKLSCVVQKLAIGCIIYCDSVKVLLLDFLLFQDLIKNTFYGCNITYMVVLFSFNFCFCIAQQLIDPFLFFFEFHHYFTRQSIESLGIRNFIFCQVWYPFQNHWLSYINEFSGVWFHKNM